MKKKETKKEKIARLERELADARACQVHNYHFASIEIEKYSCDRMMGRSVVMSIRGYGEDKGVEPFAIKGGLSKETILAIKEDMKKSYELAIEFKP